ncbi:hypothetical protein [Acinetobacter modestus]|uniref:hypothetical protein n=1 Tax=Acinetobacter modestus TaxID=1776740 RepID=UPI0030189401
MVTSYSDSFEELKAYIDQQLEISKGEPIAQEAPYSSIEKGAIEKLEKHYKDAGFKFTWKIEGENLFIATVSK